MMRRCSPSRFDSMVNVSPIVSGAARDAAGAALVAEASEGETGFEEAAAGGGRVGSA